MGFRFTRHLSNYEYPLMNYILTLHDQYEKGTLPYPGSVTDQPAKIIEIFNLLTNLKLENEQRQYKEQERLNKNGRR